MKLLVLIHRADFLSTGPLPDNTGLAIKHTYFDKQTGGNKIIKSSKVRPFYRFLKNLS